MFPFLPTGPVPEVEVKFRNPEWLKHAIIYEIYPQTFLDTNGDGIGDLPGVIEKLDYVKSLGANTIWLNPCFESPFGDAGYDISDFYKVAPRYGTNEDLKRLFIEAKQRGMRVLLDLVAGHTSVACEWFKQSSRHQPNEYSDWYIWTPNLFTRWLPGGTQHQFIAGTTERVGGYMPNFFPFQPALNYGFANPDPNLPYQQAVDAPGPRAVRAELKKIMKFWLDMGADGFRVDMAASLVKDDPGSRATIKLWQEFRAWLDADYPEAVLISEWGNPPRAIEAGFHIDFYMALGPVGYASLFRRSHGFLGMGGGYGFSIFDSQGKGNIREFTDDFGMKYAASQRAGYICLYSGNHDTSPRLGFGRTAQDLKVAFAFLLTMPGVPKIYYGDEIGMVGVQGLPSKEGSYWRTEARTPMQWSQATNAGFSSGSMEQLYLPVEADLGQRTVADQESDAESLLNTIRTLTKLRQAHPALANDQTYRVVYAEPLEYPFVYLRESAEERILVAVNPANRPVEINLTAESLGVSQAKTMACLYGVAGGLQKTETGYGIKLPGVSVGIYRV